MLVFLHEMLLKVPTSLIWSLKPYGLAVPSCLVQNSSLVLQIEVSRVGFKKKRWSHETTKQRNGTNRLINKLLTDFPILL